MVAVIVIATLQEQAVAPATGKLKVVVVVNQREVPKSEKKKQRKSIKRYRQGKRLLCRYYAYNSK